MSNKISDGEHELKKLKDELCELISRTYREKMIRQSIKYESDRWHEMGRSIKQARDRINSITNAIEKLSDELDAVYEIEHNKRCGFMMKLKVVYPTDPNSYCDLFRFVLTEKYDILPKNTELYVHDLSMAIDKPFSVTREQELEWRRNGEPIWKKNMSIAIDNHGDFKDILLFDVRWRTMDDVLVSSWIAYNNVKDVESFDLQLLSTDVVRRLTCAFKNAFIKLYPEIIKRIAEKTRPTINNITS